MGEMVAVPAGTRTNGTSSSTATAAIQPQRPIAASSTDRVGASSHRLAPASRVVAGGEFMHADTTDGAVHEADPAGSAIAGAGIDRQPRSGRRRGWALPWGGQCGVGERLPGGRP